MNNVKYDSKTQTKINAAKSSRTDYRVVIDGAEDKEPKKSLRLTIVVTKNGNFVRTYYG